MFCFDMLNNNLYIFFIAKKFGRRKFIHYLCNCKQKQIL